MRFTNIAKIGLLSILGTTAAGLVTSGCVENRSSLFVANILAPPEDCTFSPDPESLFLPSGTMLPGDAGYTGWVLVGNQLTPMANSSTLKTETSYFQAEGAEVSLYGADGSTPAADTFRTTLTSIIPPGSGKEPGYGVAPVIMVPPGLEVRGGDTFIAEFFIFGRTLGGIELETAPSQFRIQVVDFDCGTQKIVLCSGDGSDPRCVDG